MAAATVALLAGGAGAPGATVAAVSAQSDSDATVIVRVGGDRRSQPRAIDPLDGVRFGLFASKPTSFDDLGFVTANRLYTCESRADGECTFNVRIGAGGTPADTRLWVAPISGPSGAEWFANSRFQTAPLSPTPSDPREVTPYVFRTPPLRANARYVTGGTYQVGGTSYGFMNSPASQGGSPIPAARRTASGGVWPLARDNPPHPTQCGLDVALVVDLSSSMNQSVTTPAGASLKTAMDAFVGALRGTPSRAALFTFSTNTPAVYAGDNTGLRPVATTRDANAFRALYAAWTNGTASGFTNWDSGLEEVARPDGGFDLVVFLTDGLPTVFGQNATGASPSGATRFLEMENAVASANLLKRRGMRIIAVGVGAGITDSGAAHNLRAISGGTRFANANVAQADYFQEGDFGQVGGLLRNLLLEACAPSVSVIKQIVPPGGTLADAFTPSVGWRFNAQTVAPVVVTPASATTDPITGALNFDLAFDADSSPAGVTITEDPKTAAGYTPFPVNGANAVCENKSEDDAPVAVTNVGAHAFRVNVGLQDAVSCVVYNQAPGLRADLSIAKTASERVVEPGSEITYTLTVTNHGPDTAQNIVVSDPLEGLRFVSASDDCTRVSGAVSCQLPSLASGASHTFTVVARVPRTHRGGVVNTATVTSDTPDPDPGNNQDTEAVPSVTVANLSISKVASVSSVAPGEQVLYTLVVTNRGPFRATDVTVTDPLERNLELVSAQSSQGDCDTRFGLVCRLGEILDGASAQILVTARVAEGASGVVANTARVVSGETDPDEDDNRSTETVDVAAPPPTVPPATVREAADLRVTKRIRRASIRTGGTITHVLRVTNLGLDTATSVDLTDTATRGRRVLSLRPSQGTCRVGTVLTCNLGTIERRGHATVTVVTRIARAGTLINTVSATGAEPDPDTSNNMASASSGFVRGAQAVSPRQPDYTG